MIGGTVTIAHVDDNDGERTREMRQLADAASARAHAALDRLQAHGPTRRIPQGRALDGAAALKGVPAIPTPAPLPLRAPVAAPVAPVVPK